MATKQELILCGVDVERMSVQFLKILEGIPIIELQPLLIDERQNYDVSFVIKKLEEVKTPHHWYRKKGNR